VPFFSKMGSYYAHYFILFSINYIMKKFPVRHQWLDPVILATWEAEIRRTVARGQSRLIVWEIPSPK
jgi:hypothetical protein